jgi:hypothetical protein
MGDMLQHLRHADLILPAVSPRIGLTAPRIEMPR